MIQKADSILMIGACGMGMAPLALFVKGAGHTIYAYDDYPNPKIKTRLKDAGIDWVESLLDYELPDLIVLSRALGNTRFVDYLQKHFPGVEIVYRGEFLARISQDYKTIAIAGSHGKTTTTGLMIHALREAGIPISYILGGFFEDNALPAAEFNQSEYLLIEVDESDRTIDEFSPWITVITNLDLDHTGYYQSLDDLRDTFRSLVERTQASTILFKPTQYAVIGLFEENNPGLGIQTLDSMPADFNIQNQLLAKEAIKVLAPQFSNYSFNDFPGIERRQTIKKMDNGDILVEDYAHHPAELKALSEWLANRYPEHTLKVIFQPHRYTRTASLMSEFVAVLKNLDLVLIPEYAAFETKQTAASSKALFQQLQNVGADSLSYCEEPHALTHELNTTSGSPRVLAFIGAGDIDQWLHFYKQANTVLSEDQRLIEYLKENLGSSSKCLLDEQLGKKTTLNVGGSARFYVEPANLEDLQFILKAAKRFQLDVAILGKGSNTLVADSGFDGILIRLNQKYWKTIKLLREGRIWVAGGALLKEISKKAETWGLPGFEFFEGIPGAIGGAVSMNAGAMQAETGALIESLDCLDLKGNRIRLSRDELTLNYRSCPTVRGLIVISAVLSALMPERLESISSVKQGNVDYRKSTQPWEPSAGCMFKNPVNDSAGRLIDMAGLKGYRIGDAEISTKHANFLVNTGKAKSADVEAVMAHAQAVVYERFGVKLESEIRRLGS